MTKLSLTALLIAASVGAQAQPAATPASIQPAIDPPQERQALRKLSVCVAQLRPRWARTMLSYPYLSDAQASVAAQLVSGHDNCLGAPEVAVAFRTSGVVGSVAEYFVRADMPKTDSQRLSNALSTIAPRNVSEDFALCLAARNPGAAQDLAFSDPGSAGEARAAGMVAMSVPTCTKPEEHLDVDLQSLRALAATALYRGVIAATGSQELRR
jgi:hypothetical protein